MKRLALALLLLASQANGATYWVSPTGTAGASGADSTTNAKSLANVNSIVVAGDIVRFKTGTYSAPIQPNANGTSGNRIRYYGFQSAPGAVTVTNIRFGWNGSNSRGDYSTAIGFTVSGAMTGCDEVAGLYATGDSIAYCNIPASGAGFNFRTKGTVLDNCTFGAGSVTGSGQSHFIDMFNANNVYATSNRITNCTFTVTVNTPTSGTQGDVHILGMSRTHSNVVYGNTFNVTVTNVGGPGPPAHGYFFPFEQYRSYYNSFQGNAVNLTLSATPNGTHSLFAMRDSSSYNRFFGNTVTVTGPGSIGIGWNNSGSFPGTTQGNYLGNNVFKVANVDGGGVFYSQNGCRGDTIEFNVFATSDGDPAFAVGSVPFTNTIVRHNTLYTTGGNVLDMASVSSASGSRLVSNILYGTGGGRSTVAAIVPGGLGMDSVGVIFARGANPSNAIRYNGVNGAPGSGTTGYGLANKAAWNTPRFTDSTYAALNTTLLSGSPADDDNLHDGFAGANGVATVDAVRPARINPLSVTASSTSSVTLAWTAVGNDSLTGSAVSYDIRYSTGIITAANFSSAIQAPNLPQPLPAGSAESFTVTGLAAGTPYTFALKALDNSNASAMSDTAFVVTTTLGDVTAPAAVTDLAAIPTGSTSIRLSWTQTGDDGSEGTVSSWVLKRSTSAINAGNFDAATTVPYSEQPDVSGSRASYDDTGLTAATTYYYAVKGVDEVPNTGAVSNLPSAATQAASDVTAPGQITSLVATPGAGQVALSWIASGNDGAAGGAATAFDVRYVAASGLLEAAWAAATQATTGVPTPGIAGSAAGMTIAGLSNGTQYAFAVKALDAAANASTISTAATATPAALTTALTYRRGRGRR